MGFFLCYKAMKKKEESSSDSGNEEREPKKRKKNFKCTQLFLHIKLLKFWFTSLI